MAKYTIPSVLPSIKFSAPSVRKDAYTNPQYIRDRSFEVFNKGMFGMLFLNLSVSFRVALH